MKILLTGKNGQLGWELNRLLTPVADVVALGSEDLDLSEPAAIVSAVRGIQPDVILNAAAYTAVDAAEREHERAFAVNGIAPGLLAREGKRLGALIVHFSTDYVFDGLKKAPYKETDAPNPLSVYGKSKLAGERAILGETAAHIIIRVCWLYSARRRNFLLTILRLARERPELRIVDDQVGAPTWARSIAEATVSILQSGTPAERSGLYHLCASGHGSWFEFAREILRRRGLSTPIYPIKTGDFPLPAPRPENSTFDCGKIAAAFGIALPDWREDLQRCLGDIPANGL